MTAFADDYRCRNTRRTCFISRVKPVNIPEPGKSLVSHIFKPPGGQKVARIAQKISSGQMKSNMAENGATAPIPANPAYFSLVSATLTGSICHVIKVNRVIARLSETSAPIVSD
ncbi:uncharacterized protein LOC134240675 [Saccostrea cucullata]|uniref:uncharacterized protein LOC134240675 n=1 Tax=Saccostrea cuccullata TaxID=36930 RepID=UPI002ED6B42C